MFSPYFRRVVYNVTAFGSCQRRWCEMGIKSRPNRSMAED